MEAKIENLLGLGVQPIELTLAQVCLRGIIVFIAALIIVRIANKRFLAKMTAFDSVLGFILASALARAINGSAPFFPTLVMALVLVLLHRALSRVAFHSGRLGHLIKGTEAKVVQGGELLRETMQKHNISERDLLEEARLNGQVTELGQIKTATLERSGQISVIPKES